MNVQIATPCALLLLSLTLSGCVSIKNPGIEIAPLPSASTPVPVSGDFYVFSDGYIEEVVGSNALSTHWSLGYGSTQAIKRHEIELLPVEWESGKTKFSLEIQNQSRSLWPLVVGNKSDVSATVTATTDNVSQQFSEDWNCSVPKSMRLTLSAGQFDTFLIDCRRSSASGAHWQRRRLNYAPSIGHYVRAIEEVRTHSFPGYVFKQRDLIDFRKFSLTGSDESRQALIQAALDKQPADASVALPGATPGTAESMLIGASFLTKDNLHCRQAKFNAAAFRPYAATLCNTAGGWRYAEIALDPPAPATAARPR
jgi:hypothetical protein